MKLHEAFLKFLDNDPFIFQVEPSPCTLCRRVEELRAGVCFDCKDLIEVTEDMKEVFEVKNPSNRWPFVYRVGTPNL